MSKKARFAFCTVYVEFYYDQKHTSESAKEETVIADVKYRLLYIVRSINSWFPRRKKTCTSFKPIILTHFFFFFSIYKNRGTAEKKARLSNYLQVEVLPKVQVLKNGGKRSGK